MRFFTFFLCGLLFAAGCSSSSSDALTSSERGPDGSPSTGTGIVYEGESPLTLAPGERARLSFVVVPSGAHPVRLAMMGDSGDASLDADLVTTSSDGRVSVELVAPSSSRTFIVRASLDSGSSAQVPVSVSGLGFGSIEVVPVYSGKRSIKRWTATVATGTTCAELVGIPPPDGPLVSEASPPRNPVVKAAPVGPALVVTARAGYFAGGCVDVKGLGVGETKRVTVSVLDRPLDIEASELSVMLGFEANQEHELLGFFEDVKDKLSSALPQGSEAQELLDAMADTLPSQLREAFDEGRHDREWDALVAADLQARGVSFRALALEWIASGKELFDLASGLEGWLSPDPSKGAARFDASTFIGLKASEMQMPSPVSVTWSAAPGDRVQLGGAFSFSRIALVAHAAEGRAKLVQAGASTLGDALADALSCGLLGESLADTSPLLECDADCLALACADALSLLWERTVARAKGGEARAVLKVTASGEAEVSNEAKLTGFTGSWVGSLSAGERSLSVKGVATGK